MTGHADSGALLTAGYCATAGQRESPAVPLGELLLQKGANHRSYDLGAIAAAAPVFFDTRSAAAGETGARL